MTSRTKGRNLQFSVARRLVIDYLWASAGMARVSVTRSVKLSDVMSVRRLHAEPPSLTAIFVKAFALVAVETPELRRVYMKWPWPHLHEYADNTVNIAHEVQIMGDTALLPLRLRQPELLSLRLLSECIRQAADEPIEASRFYRYLFAYARYPVVLRRPIAALCLNVPRLRRYIFGTYSISSVSRWQGELGQTIAPVACLLSYGPIDSSGHVRVRLNFDHRIFDGAFAARVLTRLDQVLNSSLLQELRDLGVTGDGPVIDNVRTDRAVVPR